MNTENNQTCQHCQAFYKEKEQCRRYPPELSGTESAFPKVSPDDWCLAFRTKRRLITAEALIAHLKELERTERGAINTTSFCLTAAKLFSVSTRTIRTKINELGAAGVVALEDGFISLTTFGLDGSEPPEIKPQERLKGGRPVKHHWATYREAVMSFAPTEAQSSSFNKLCRAACEVSHLSTSAFYRILEDAMACGDIIKTEDGRYYAGKPITSSPDQIDLV